MKWYKNPLTVFSLGLLLFGTAAVAYNWRLEVYSSLLAVALGAGMAWWGLRRGVKKMGHLWQNAVISGIIAFLLLNPPLNLSLEALAWLALGGALVMSAKWWPQWRHQPIFNPVALGLLILNGLLGFIYGADQIWPTFISWWGTDFAGSWALLLLLPLVLYGAFRFRKLPLLLAFLLFNALYLLWSEGGNALPYVYLSGTIYFLAGVMLIEPKTSPTIWQVQVLAAFLALLTYRFGSQIGLGALELWAIIAVNLTHLLSRYPWSKLLRHKF